MVSHKSSFLKPLYQKLIVAILLGAMQVFAFAPFAQWWVIYPSFVGLFLLLQTIENSKKQFFTVIFAFNLAMFVATIHWVYVSMALFGGMPTAVSILLLLLLCAYLAVFPSIAIWAATRLKNTSYTIRYLVAIPVFWLVMDWVRGWFLTGFPWGYLGYSHADTPLVGFAPILGVQGITLSIMLICGALTLLIQKQHVKLMSALILGLIITGFSLSKLNYTNLQPAINVALVQGNIPQNDKWEVSNLYPSLNQYLTLSERGSSTEPHKKVQDELIIWPESAVAALELNMQVFLQRLDRQLKKEGKTLITGVIDYNLQSKDYYNTIIMLGDLPTGQGYSMQGQNRYRKHQLLPIGEFVPFEDFLRPLAPYFNLPMSSFQRGNAEQPNLQSHQGLLAPAICYEIAFPELLRKNVHPETGILLTISNDAWFGESIAAAQHLQIARMRSIELARPLLRSTNTGITAIFDDKGKELGRIETNVADVLRTQIQPAIGQTPYQKWGDIPLYILVILGLSFLFIMHRRKLINEE